MGYVPDILFLLETNPAEFEVLDEFDPDWLPTQNLGHSERDVDPSIRARAIVKRVL